MHRKIAVGAVLGALALPAAADAHVTLQPTTAAAGSFSVFAVRVPNERDNASTRRVVLRMPVGFSFVSYEAEPGWRIRIVRTRLATPVQTEDGPVTTRVSRITFTATRRSAWIRPDQFADFRLSVQVPGQAGDQLVFPALQTYSGGEVVRWTGAPSSDTPAPRVTVTAPAAEG